jgi:hypothetical protein
VAGACAITIAARNIHAICITPELSTGHKAEKYQRVNN